jgi:hypothetical protein
MILLSGDVWDGRLRRTIEIKLIYNTIFSRFIFDSFFQRNIGSTHSSLASVVSSGSPTKNLYSSVASNISNAFKGAAFAGRKSTGDRNLALYKDGKLFVQSIYPENEFTDGVSSTTFYIKVVHEKGGKIVPVWYFSNNILTAAFKEVLKSTSVVDLGSDWLNYPMKFLVETKTHDTCVGADVQKLRQDKWTLTHLTTYVSCGDTLEDTVSRVKAVAECVMTYLSESVGYWDEMYYTFEEVFGEQVSPGLLKLLETDGFAKLRDIGIEVGTTKSLDEFCMDNFICDAVFYCFCLDQELLLGPKEQ